jgi:hypothetical protein
MPDTLKQFYNATIDVTGLTGAQTATLFTNNATTRAVIKDIDVANTFPVAPNLTVGGTSVAGLVGSVTGSEIADVSQAVGISFPTALDYSRLDLQYLSATAGNTTRTTTTSYRINSVGVRSVVTAAENAASRTNSYHGYYYVAADNDVFFVDQNGNNNFILAKRAGGPTGTASNVVSSTWPIAYDGRYYYYLTSTTNLRRFDPETEAVTNTTITAVGTAGLSTRMIHSNGYLYYQVEDGSLPYIIKISNGFWSRQGSWSTGIYTANARSMPGFFIDPVTLIATVIWVDASNQTIRSRTNTAVSSFASASQTDTTTITSITKTASLTQYHTVSMLTASTGLMYNVAGNTCLMDFTPDNSAGWTVAPALNSPITDVNFIFSYTTSTPTVNTTNFPSTISLRITGVEVTP